MGDMLALGEAGIRLICDQIIPAGTGDDTKARFAVESLSRFLSKNGNAICRKKCGKKSVSVMPPVRRTMVSRISLLNSFSLSEGKPQLHP